MYENWVTKQVSIAPLVTFRILFGLLMLISVVRFWFNGWITSQYINPEFYFPFFPWIKPVPGIGMYMVFGFMTLATLGIIFGWFYRLSASVFFLLFSYVELIDKTNYLNHYYFVSLVAFLLMLLPAHHSFSMDVKRGAVKSTSTCAVLYINALKLQLGMVYFFAGVAKINADWLLKAQPLQLWLSAHVHKPIIGELFRWKITAFLFSWTGTLYDLTIPFFLSRRKTRVPAYLAVVGFHLITYWLFPIGMFPFIMIGATLIYFPASFHEKLLSHLSQLPKEVNTAFLSPSDKKTNAWKFGALAIFFVFQVLFPFRHLAYPGDLFWTEQGYRFSWRVMLMEKAGHATFTIYDRHSDRKVQAANYEYLTPQQEKMMATQPDMMLQYAHFLASEYQSKGFENPIVTVDAFVTLNGRRNKRFIDPDTDLAAIEDNWSHKEWVLSND